MGRQVLNHGFLSNADKYRIIETKYFFTSNTTFFIHLKLLAL